MSHILNSTCTCLVHILGYEVGLGPLTNAFGENSQFSLQIMFTSRHFNSAIIRYFPKFAHMYLCGIHYQWLWPSCCKFNSFGDIDTVNWDNGCRGPNGTSAWPRSRHEPSIHHGLSSVRRRSPAARAYPIGSNQVWRLRDVGSLPRILDQYYGITLPIVR